MNYNKIPDLTATCVPLFMMVNTVEQFILMHTGRVVHIVVENDKQLQMLGRAYDYATCKQFTKL